MTTAAEFETVALCIAVEAIDNTVNHALLKIRSSAGKSEVVFPSFVHCDLFMIRVLDFATEEADPQLIGNPGSCLDALIRATETASFDRDNSVMSLVTATAELRAWLDEATHYNMWLPTLALNAAFSVKRSTLVRVGANQAKHNLSRLTRISKTVHRALMNNGFQVPLEKIPLALDDVSEHLHEDYFPFYCTWLSELMNNIRWGIQDYLLPQFAESYCPSDDGLPAYSYKFPTEIAGDLHKEWFWRLMNNVRRVPCLPRFQARKYMKKNDIPWQRLMCVSRPTIGCKGPPPNRYAVCVPSGGS